MGGTDNSLLGGHFNNDVWRLTDEGKTWTEVKMSAGWAVRSDFSSVALPDGSVVIMGGYDKNADPLHDVWRSTTAGSSLQNPSHTYPYWGSTGKSPAYNYAIQQHADDQIY